MADEEDVAVSVFQSLCEGAAAGRFDKLSNREDLWSLLVAMTRMKAVDQIRHQTAKKRGGRELRGDSILQNKAADASVAGFDAMLGDDPTPELLASMEEELANLLQSLPDQSQRKVAKLRIQGYSNDEIASLLDMSTRTVERKLKVVRSTWTAVLDSCSG